MYICIFKYKDQLDWKKIQYHANKYEMLHQVFCIFNNLNEVYVNFIDDRILKLFHPRNKNYSYFGMSSGSVVPWKSNFLYRLFNQNERITEYRKLNLINWYSDINENYKSPYVVGRRSGKISSEFTQYVEFKDLRNKDIAFKYAFSSDNDNVYISLNINDLASLDNYVFAFFFMYDTLLNTHPQEYKFKWVLFEKRNNKIYTWTVQNLDLNNYDKNTSKETADIISETDLQVIFESKICKKKLLNEIKNENSMLCYNAFIFMKNNNYLFPSSIKFSHPDFPEETEHMGVIRL
ncbi:hypothetical protein J416_15062 [Gracilibacillus halophilus YIM-C55.5]|uniref:Uncharacterized protein n=1 Tax=Gracilibacillus halophilus YIM-C55.5 TaxID=1308866 RepID=N4W5Z9_9BACI|nr:hypothetical protein [Gracilibacillus halophilus]ENH95628.1 hypothetical protein J416_15062 [Gracilibacillus halophilus YIM-C55.5]